MRNMMMAGLAASMLSLAAGSAALAAPPDFVRPNGGSEGAFRNGSPSNIHASTPNFRPGGGGGFRGPGGGGGFRGQGGGFRGGDGFRGGGYRGGGYGGGYRHHHGGYGGAAIGAGVAGLAAGALIGGAIASQPGYYGDPGYPAYSGYPAPAYGTVDEDQDVVAAPATGDATAYCVQRFKSYDPASGTYLGYDGMRHPCP